MLKDKETTDMARFETVTFKSLYPNILVLLSAQDKKD